MESRRVKRINESLIRNISDIIRNMKDTRLHDDVITVCGAVVSSDVSFCKVYISTLKGINHSKKICKVLNYASGHIQCKLSSRLKTRIIPKILFLPSNSDEYAFEIEKIISKNKMNDKNKLNQICDFLKQHDNFAIYTHQNPDGDAISSCTALCLLLRKMGKNAKVIYGENFDSKFQFMNDFLNCNSGNEKFEEEYNICLDVFDIDRVDNFMGSNFDVCIDHHDVSFCNFSGLYYIDKNYSSCSEIIYDIIKILNVEIDENMSSCIYTGIICDTGRFNWSNVNENTFKVSSEIFSKVDKSINRKIFGNVPKNIISFQSEIIKNFEYINRYCVCFVPLNMQNKFNLKYSDLDFLPSFPLQILGVDVSIVAKELSEGVFKVSVRSYNGEAINICKKFGGGGHENASGFNICGNCKEIREKILKIINL